MPWLYGIPCASAIEFRVYTHAIAMPFTARMSISILDWSLVYFRQLQSSLCFMLLHAPNRRGIRLSRRMISAPWGQIYFDLSAARRAIQCRDATLYSFSRHSAWCMGSLAVIELEYAVDIAEFEQFMAHRRYQPHIAIIFIKTCRMEMVNHTIWTISCYLELKYSEILWCAIHTLSSWFEVLSTGIITASAAGLVNMPFTIRVVSLYRNLLCCYLLWRYLLFLILLSFPCSPF